MLDTKLPFRYRTGGNHLFPIALSIQDTRIDASLSSQTDSGPFSSLDALIEIAISPV